MRRLCWGDARMKHSLFAIAVVTLAGCATTPQDCDPGNRDAGFINKAGCVYGGHYDQRVQERQAILVDEQKANQLFRATYDALQQESTQVATDLAAQQASVDRLSGSVKNLLGEIRSKAAGNQQIEQQITAVETQLQQLQTDMDAARASGTAMPALQQRQQVAELQVKVQDLQQALGLR